MTQSVKKFLSSVLALAMIAFTPTYGFATPDSEPNPQLVTANQNYGQNGDPGTYGALFNGSGNHILLINNDAGGSWGSNISVGSTDGKSFDDG